MKRLARIIVADVPIKYNDRKETRKDNPGKKAKFGIGSDGHYVESMNTEKLCSLGPLLQAFSAPDAYLFYWTTTPTAFGVGKEKSAKEVMEAWGFRYVSLAFPWEKLYKGGKSFEGGGSYVPANIEWCLLGVRGRPWHTAKGAKPQQVIREPHPRDPVTGKIIHSRKPETAQERIEQWLWPQLFQTAVRHKQGEEEIVPVTDYTPYSLELFATRQRAGWTCVGHSIDGQDIFDALRRLGELGKNEESYVPYKEEKAKILPALDSFYGGLD